MITALVSKKGGVGKTTTSVNLGAALADAGRRVLLIDLDSQASASLSLGVDRARLAPSVADAILAGAPLAEAIRPTGVPRLDLVTASVDLVNADFELGALRGRETKLARALAPLAERYDEILLDCPPSFSLLTVNALVAADAFIAPTSPQFLAVTAVQSLLEGAERVRVRFNRELEALGVLLTLVDYRASDTRAHVDRLRTALGALVFAVEIRVNVRLAEAPAHGRTIFQHAPTATGAAAYRLLADEFLLRAERIRRREAAPAATA